jgi:hypothetical protein
MNPPEPAPVTDLQTDLERGSGQFCSMSRTRVNAAGEQSDAAVAAVIPQEGKCRARGRRRAFTGRAHESGSPGVVLITFTVGLDSQATPPPANGRRRRGRLASSVRLEGIDFGASPLLSAFARSGCSPLAE